MFRLSEPKHVAYIEQYGIFTFLWIHAALIGYYLQPIRNTLMKVGLTGCPETSLTNYQSTLLKIPE